MYKRQATQLHHIQYQLHRHASPATNKNSLPLSPPQLHHRQYQLHRHIASNKQKLSISLCLSHGHTVTSHTVPTLQTRFTSNEQKLSVSVSSTQSRHTHSPSTQRHASSVTSVYCYDKGHMLIYCHSSLSHSARRLITTSWNPSNQTQTQQAAPL